MLLLFYFSYLLQAEELSEKCARYTRTDSTSREKDRKRWYWPLVKCVTVRVPNYAFQHVTLVDLPGTGDRNASRDKMWKEVIYLHALLFTVCA